MGRRTTDEKERRALLRRGIFKVLRGLALVVVGAVLGVVGVQQIGSGIQDIHKATAVQWVGTWHFTQTDADGNVVWEDTTHNALVDGGEEKLLTTYFLDATEPTAFYLGLSDADTCSIGETDSLTTAMTGEPSTNGYSRQTITRDSSGFPTSGLDSGDWQVESSTETFSASGGSWGPVNCAVLADSSDNTGEIIAFVALSTARTLADGESLQVSMDVKLQ